MTVTDHDGGLSRGTQLKAEHYRQHRRQLSEKGLNQEGSFNLYQEQR